MIPLSFFLFGLKYSSRPSFIENRYNFHSSWMSVSCFLYNNPSLFFEILLSVPLFFLSIVLLSMFSMDAIEGEGEEDSMGGVDGGEEFGEELKLD